MFDDLAADSAIFFEDFGHEGIYAPIGAEPETVRCQLFFDVQTLNTQGDYETAHHVSLPVQTGSVYRVGATLTVNAVSYTLHEKLEDNGFTQRWLIH